MQPPRPQYVDEVALNAYPIFEALEGQYLALGACFEYPDDGKELAVVRRNRTQHKDLVVMQEYFSGLLMRLCCIL